MKREWTVKVADIAYTYRKQKENDVLVIYNVIKRLPWQKKGMK